MRLGGKQLPLQTVPQKQSFLNDISNEENTAVQRYLTGVKRPPQAPLTKTLPVQRELRMNSVDSVDSQLKRGRIALGRVDEEEDTLHVKRTKTHTEAYHAGKEEAYRLAKWGSADYVQGKTISSLSLFCILVQTSSF